MTPVQWVALGVVVLGWLGVVLADHWLYVRVDAPVRDSRREPVRRVVPLLLRRDGMLTLFMGGRGVRNGRPF